LHDQRVENQSLGMPKPSPLSLLSKDILVWDSESLVARSVLESQSFLWSETCQGKPEQRDKHFCHSLTRHITMCMSIYF
jgi:hypothetical protein